MLGNDVIDLADPETSSRHPRFDARVFGATERALLARSEDAGRLRQVLWAAKEAGRNKPATTSVRLTRWRANGRW